MKIRYICWAIACWISAHASAQLPLLVGGLENRAQHFQDSIIISVQLDAPFIPFAENNGSYLTSDILPFLFLLEEDTVTGVELITREEITLFPNPVRDQFIIQRKNPAAASWILIYDDQGREVRRIAWPAQVISYQMSIGRFAPGTYYVNVQDPSTGQTTTIRLLKL